MRNFARVLGFLFLVLTLVILAADLVAAADGSKSEIMPLGALWYALDPGSLNLVQAVIERYIWQALWDPVLIGFLGLPAMPFFGCLGIVLIALSFLPKPKSKQAPIPELPKKAPISVMKKLAGKARKKSAARAEPRMKA